MPQLQFAAAGLDERGAAIDPVTVVAVEHALDVRHLGSMDMTTDDAVQPATARGVRRGGLEAVHVAHRVADATLEVAGERPVAVTKAVTQRIEAAVQPEHHVVQTGAEGEQPAIALHHAIEFITVHDQELLSVQRFMNVFAAHFQVAEANAADLAKLLVVVAGHVDHPCATLGLAEDRAQNVTVRLRPIEAAAQAPDIDDVADQDQLIGLDPAQKVEHQLGAAVARAEVNVGDKSGAYLNSRSRARLHASLYGSWSRYLVSRDVMTIPMHSSELAVNTHGEWKINGVKHRNMTDKGRCRADVIRWFAPGACQPQGRGGRV